MVTTDERTPTLAERATGASLLVAARVGDRIDTTVSEPEPIEDELQIDPSRPTKQVTTTYELRVEDVLVGDLDRSRIRLRVVGGHTETAETKPTLELDEGETVALFLAPDYGPGDDGRTFVPYFDGAYHVDDDEVDLPEREMEELRASLEVDRPTLDDLGTFARRERERLGSWEERLGQFEPDDALERPYPPVDEQPESDAEGPTSAEPLRRDRQEDTEQRRNRDD